MPGEQYLLLQMHEMLSYLNQSGVTTLLILGQHGMIGDMRSDIDLSYLSDAILMFRFFEAKGEVRTAVSAVKSRTSAHERFIREFKLGANGLQLGEALRDFEGVMTGLPSYEGKVSLLRSLGDSITASTRIRLSVHTGMSVNRLRPPLYDARHALLIVPYEYESRITLAPTAAIFFPGGVERSLTQKPWRPGNAFFWNQSTSQTRSDWPCLR